MEPTERADSVDFPVASNEWEDYLIAFRVKLGQETYPQGPDIAVFWLSKSTQLRVIRDGKSLTADIPSFVEVSSPELVQTIYDLMPQGNRRREPYYIYMTAIRDRRVIFIPIRIAEFKFKPKDQFIERTGGVIHNPPS